MGSLFAPKSAPTPPPPPPTPAPSVRDEIGGTEQVPVKNADGSTTYITRRLPLTAEQQAEQDEYKRIMQEALDEIEKLSSSSYEHDDETKKVLDAWSAQRNDVLADSFTIRETNEEKILARRGLADSSAANGIRRQRRLDRQEAKEQLEREETLLGDDIKNRNLGIQQNLFNLASSRQDLDLVKSQRSVNSGISAFNSVDSSNRASIADYYNRQLSYNSGLQNTSSGMFSMFSPSSSAQGGNSAGSSIGGILGGAIGTSVGGPIGGAIGSSLGSSIGGSF